jgi:assimilatory nitrate reductase catalytic subunit
MSFLVERRTTKTTCCYCGVGCGMLVHTETVAGRTEIKSVEGDPGHPANHGRLCTKGSTLGLTTQAHIYTQTRAQAPELRHTKTARREAVSWEQASEHVAQRLAELIAAHGPESVGVYVSGQLLTEDYYVFNKLVKGLIGTNNIDTNSRLCMSSAVAGYKQSFGADAPPCSYTDIEHAKVIFITGSNTAYAHPILFRRIEAARALDPELKLIVVDPRRTDTAKMADLFLQILPGTDVALYHGMLHLMLWENWLDQHYIDTYTEGFSALKTLVRDYTPKAVAEICGISEDDLHQGAKLFATSPATLSLYCQGLNQSSSGTDKNTALINLHLATGQLGKPGAGPFSLTGQPNAMGGREVGGLANLLSGHRDLKNPSHRQEVANFWRVTEVPATPGLSAIPMFEALRTGQLKAIWIVCTNPAQSLPDQGLVHEALQRAEFVVVQEAYAHTATTAYADVLLPATTWAEKDGTVTNSERCISRVRPALAPFGQARQDWAIAIDIAKRLESKLDNTRHLERGSLFEYENAQAIWADHQALTRGRDLDITGLSYARLDSHGPAQWPYPTGALEGCVRLYEDGVFQTESGKARFIASPYRATAERTDARYPIGLLTGRLRDQWHGMSRTGTLARLYAHAPEACIEISAGDARRLELTDGDLVYVTSRRGVQVLPVQLSNTLRSSQAFIAMHWGGEFVSGQAGKVLAQGVNSLTIAALDPVSGQPELKFAAIKVAKANLPWHLSAFGWFDQATALSLQHRLRALFSNSTFATATLFGRDDARQQTGVSLTLANLEPFEPDLLEQIRKLFAFDQATGHKSVMTYRDSRKAVERHLIIEQSAEKKLLSCVLLTGSVIDLEARVWLKQYLETLTDVSALGRKLLSPGKVAPAPVEARGKIICNCFDVSERSIKACLSQAATTDSEHLLNVLQTKLACGTNCGSCLPELKGMVTSHVG